MNNKSLNIIYIYNKDVRQFDWSKCEIFVFFNW